MRSTPVAPERSDRDRAESQPFPSVIDPSSGATLSISGHLTFRDKLDPRRSAGERIDRKGDRESSDPARTESLNSQLTPDFVGREAGAVPIFLSGVLDQRLKLRAQAQRHGFEIRVIDGQEGGDGMTALGQDQGSSSSSRAYCPREFVA